MSGYTPAQVSSDASETRRTGFSRDLPDILLGMALLLFIDLILRVGGFPMLTRFLKRLRKSPDMHLPEERILRICTWMWTAPLLYLRRVRCLERAAALVSLLRIRGVAAELVIGVQTPPFRSHAWVEINGAVINDSPDVKDRHLEIDRL